MLARSGWTGDNGLCSEEHWVVWETMKGGGGMFSNDHNEFRYHHGLSWTEDVRERREKNHLGYSLTPREI